MNLTTEWYGISSIFPQLFIKLLKKQELTGDVRLIQPTSKKLTYRVTVTTKRPENPNEVPLFDLDHQEFPTCSTIGNCFGGFFFF